MSKPADTVSGTEANAASTVSPENAPSHLLFDLGGVIVELDGHPIEPAWIRGERTSEEIWRLWLMSRAPREFESGRSAPEDFAREIVAELDLDVTPETFLARFERLPLGPFPGALDLLHALKGRYRTGIFSNSNTLHWPRKMGEMRLDDAVHDHFASHLIGHAKPGPDGFEHVRRCWNVDPGRILFLDDNALNVEAGHAAGFRAERVNGLDETRQALTRHGVHWA